MTAGRRRTVAFVAWAVLTTLAIVAFRTIEWRLAFEAMRQLHPGWLVIAVTLNAAILLPWAAFWGLLVPRRRMVPYGRMLEVTAMSAAAMNTLPALAGHATGIALLERRAGIGREGALSVIALDQLGEGMAKLTLFLLIGVLVPMPDWIRPGVVAGALTVGAMLVGLVWMSHRHRDGDPDEQPRHGAWGERLRAFGARWASSLEALRSWRLSLAGLGLALLVKATEGLAIVAVQYAFRIDVSVATTLLVLGTLTLATLVAVTPGNLGTYEAAVFFAYRYMGVPPEQALPLAIVQHVVFLVPVVGIGYALLMARGIGWNRLGTAPSAARAREVSRP
jgi:uncharacterized membrane protein YbhN (UPF0104 family)